MDCHLSLYKVTGVVRNMSNNLGVSDLTWAVKPGYLATSKKLEELSCILNFNFDDDILPLLEDTLKTDKKFIVQHESTNIFEIKLLSYDMASTITLEVLKKAK